MENECVISRKIPLQCLHDLKIFICRVTTIGLTCVVCIPDSLLCVQCLFIDGLTFDVTILADDS
jgi:hypothetical protein